MLPGHCPQSSQNPVNYVRAQALEPKGLGSNPAPDHPLAELPWAGAFTSLCLSVHICKMGMARDGHTPGTWRAEALNGQVPAGCQALS